jgi:hypothetical protein
VDVAIVEKRDVQRDGSGEALDPFRERIGEPREPLALLADGAVIPFNLARAYGRQIVYPVDVESIGLHESRGSVAANRGVHVVLY